MVTSALQCGVGELYEPLSKDCRPSDSVECGPRHCSDERRCPCINYVEELGEECPDTGPTLLFPDMRECARYLNCTAGCITSVMVRPVQSVERTILTPNLTSAPMTISTT